MTPEIILHTNYRPSMELSAQDIGKHMKRLKLNDARGISTKGQRSRLRDMNTYETSLQDRFKQDASQKAEVSLKDEEFTSVDNPVLSFFGPATKNVIKRSERFTEQEYNLYEYGRIIDTEALVARTFTKKKGLMFRNGYELSSKNKKNIDYIEKRFREIAMVSKRPWQVILDELATSLISLHNSFYVNPLIYSIYQENEWISILDSWLNHRQRPFLPRVVEYIALEVERMSRSLSF